MSESQLSNPLFITLKATLACALALSLDAVLGNPDHVSSTFVAVLCISPTVLIGLKNAWAQFLGSLIGGLWGTWAALVLLPPSLAVPLAVGLAIGSTFILRVGSGYPVAAFTALFLLLVPRGEPVETLEIRVLALFIAALSSFLVNMLVSSMLYRSIYQRRLNKLHSFIFTSLPAVLNGNHALADNGFALLAQLQQQLRQTLQELQLRHAWKTHQHIQRFSERTQALTYLLHLIWDLAHLHKEHSIPLSESEDFLDWIQHPQPDRFPLLPDPLLGVQKRIVYVLRQLDNLR